MHKLRCTIAKIDPDTASILRNMQATANAHRAARGGGRWESVANVLVERLSVVMLVDCGYR